MKWLGKFIGSTIGYVLGGIAGAIGGAIAGSAIDSDKFTKSFRDHKNSDRFPVLCPHCNNIIFINKSGLWKCNFCHGQSFHNLDSGPTTPGEEPKSLMLLTTLSLLGKIACAGGTISSEKDEIIENFVRFDLDLDESTVQFSLEHFHNAAVSKETFNEIAASFKMITSGNKKMTLPIIDLMFKIATVSGTLPKEERRLIWEARRIFNISINDFNNIKYRYVSVDTSTDEMQSNYYEILGSDENDSFETIRKKYKKLAAKNHPDKIFSKTKSEEEITEANRKFQKIQEAYEAIKKERNIR